MMPATPEKSTTTLIPVQLSASEFKRFIVPHLSLPKLGCHGERCARKLCNARQTSMITSWAPAFRRRLVSWTMPQRLSLLLPCSIRTRRRAIRRFAAFCSRARDRHRSRRRGRLGRHDPCAGGDPRGHRVVCVATTLGHALKSLAVAVPGWLRAHRRPEWRERSGPRVHDDRVPTGEQSRQAYAQMVGLEGYA
jgi:hypothetical protein